MVKLNRIVFAGTPDFASTHLQGLLDEKWPIIACFTQPDRPQGRGKKNCPSPVKQLSQKRNIPIYQPESLTTSAGEKILSDLQADLLIVVAYGLLLPKPILALPKQGCINVHASLLPLWRGAAPIQQAILSGDKQTGVTIMQMDEGLDTGDILLQAALTIEPKDTSGTLFEKLAILGTKTLLTALKKLESNAINPKPQNAELATYARKIQKKSAIIDWSKKAVDIERKIRAFNPKPIAHSQFKDQILRIWQAEIIAEPTPEQPGTIVNFSQAGLDIATGENILRITKAQLPSKKPLISQDLFNAYQKIFQINHSFQ